MIVAKKQHAGAVQLAAEICGWLSAREICSWQARGEDGLLDLSMSPDCVVVLGGDGTILGAARCLAGKNIPIFGVNFGKVGFLTTANQDNWEQMLAVTLAGQMHLRLCAALSWSLDNGRGGQRNGVAVNEVVLGHGALARLIGAQVTINGRIMGKLRCDGLIACTPVGSTGYSASAGGPVIYSEMNVIGLTPICPFQSDISPLVFPADTDFELKIAPHTPDCHLTVDGQLCLSLEENDVLRIRLWPQALGFYGSPEQFLDRLLIRGFGLI